MINFFKKNKTTLASEMRKKSLNNEKIINEELTHILKLIDLCANEGVLQFDYEINAYQYKSITKKLYNLGFSTIVDGFSLSDKVNINIKW